MQLASRIPRDSYTRSSNACVGELLKLGIDVGLTTVAKYMAGRRQPPPGLEDLSAQSRHRHCVDGFVRSPDDLVSAVVWISIRRDCLDHVVLFGERYLRASAQILSKILQ
jgi:hypothetical protein